MGRLMPAGETPTGDSGDALLVTRTPSNPCRPACSGCFFNNVTRGNGRRRCGCHQTRDGEL